MNPLYDPLFKRKVELDSNYSIVLFVWMGVRIRDTNKRIRETQLKIHNETRLRNELEIRFGCLATPIPVLQREDE